jgi:hypothetical protein
MKASRFRVYRVAPSDRALKPNKHSFSKAGSLLLRLRLSRRTLAKITRRLSNGLGRRNNSTQFFKRPEEYLYTLFSSGRAGTCQQFLGYHGAEVNGWGICIVKFTYKRERASGLNKVDVKVCVDQVLCY